MSAPILQSSSPTNGQTAVAKNASIGFTFDVALDPATVSGSTVVLWNSMLNQRVEAEIGLSGDGKKITITPSGHLFPNAGYRVRIVGEDTSASCVKSLAGDPLALTITSVFQTGDTLESGSVPTETEGDIDLPTDVAFVGGPAGPLKLTAASPEHQAFGILPSVAQISFRFSAAIDLSTVTGNVTIRQSAFYDEAGFLARETDLGKGDGVRYYFGAETGYYNDADTVGLLDPALFRERTYELSVEDGDLVISFEDDYLFPKNTAIEITLGADLADTDGNTLGDDFVWFGCVQPYPDWASLLAVRHQAGFGISSTFPDSYVGLRTWMATIDLLGEFNWSLPTDKPSRYAMEYVRCKSAIEIWSAVLEEKGANAGTSKRLGDFEVSVNTAAGSARPAKMRILEDRIEELDRYLWGGLTQTPRVGIRSILDPYEPGRGYFRDRLWRDEVAKNKVANGLPAANTAMERAQPHSDTSILNAGVPFPGGPGVRHQV